MGFVVYLKKDGELLRYYDSEATAQSQVTAHNRKAVINALKGVDRGVSEWSMCKWNEFEQIFAEHYANNKSYFLHRSSWR